MKKLLERYKGLSIQTKATLWFTISNTIQKGFLFLTVPIYTHLLTTEEYGKYSIFLSWLEIIEILATFRIGWGGYVVGLSKFEDDRDRYTSSMQCLSVVITTAALLLYIALHGPINTLTKLDTPFVLSIFGIVYALPAIQFWMVRKRVELKYISVFIFSALSSAAVIGFGTLSAIFFPQKDLAVVVSRLAVQGLIGIALIWINCHRNFTFFEKTYWKRALTFNVPLIPYYLSMVVLHSSDRIIIGNLEGESCAAIYGAAYAIASCMQIFNQSFTNTIQPWMYKCMRENDTKKVSRIISISMLIVAILNIMLISLAPEILLITPSKYREAVWIIPPLAASAVVMYFYQQFVNVEFYFEESRLIAIASIGAAMLNVFLNYMFIPKFGYFAAGYTTLASYSVFAVCHYIFMIIVCKKKQYKEKLIDMKQMLLILVSFFVFAVALMIGYKFFVIRYVGLLVTCILLFCFRNKIKEIFELKKKKKQE